MNALHCDVGELLDLSDLELSGLYSRLALFVSDLYSCLALFCPTKVNSM